MRIFNKSIIGKTASALMATALTMGVTSTAQAVYVSPDGTGQVLLYPYYTAQASDGGSSYVTAISIVNSSQTASKYLKVRIREGEASEEVLDFNLFLSVNDVWTAAIVQTASGAKITTLDTSCTVPAIPAAGVDFRTDAFTGANADGGTATAARTREGHIEIISLGDMADATEIGYITHAANGAAPTGCGTIRTLIAGGLIVDLDAPGNDVFGGATLINVALGVDFTYDATALADFTAIPLPQSLATEIPNFTDPAADTFSDTFNDEFSFIGGVFTGITTTTVDWTGVGPNAGVNAVSASLMRTHIMNEYVAEAATLSGTDWVITFPTKRYYTPYNAGAPVGGLLNSGTGIGDDPFQRDFNNGSCDDIVISYWDREEWENDAVIPGLDFSPAPTVTPTTAQLCHEVNVVTFNDANVLGSAIGGIQTSINVGSRESGWAMIEFVQDPNGADVTPSLTDGVTTYYGLPVLGFMVQDFTNTGAAAGVLATYGGNFVHKTRTLVEQP